MPPLHETRSYERGFPLHATRVRNLEFLAHWHTDIELLFVASGSILASVNQAKRRLGPLSLVVCGSRDIHYYERDGGGSQTILVIFKGELVGRSPLWPASGRLGCNFALPGTGSRLAEAAARIMPELEREMEQRKPSYEGLVRGEALELLSLAERELSASAAERGERSGDERGFPALESMQLAIDFIYERSAYPISLVDAAKTASLSPSYFSRVFARTTGTSFRAFLNGIRIERAEEMIADSGAKLADIAFECGFESVRSFNRAFRALRGTTPGSIREP